MYTAMVALFGRRGHSCSSSCATVTYKQVVRGIDGCIPLPITMPVDRFQVASSWLQQFGQSLQSGNTDATASCIHPNGYLRDILVFTWNNRCLHGRGKITAYLIDTLDKASITDLKLESRLGLAPEYGRLTDKLPLRAVSAGFTFQCKIGPGRGYFTLVPADFGEWKALAVMMALADIRGYEEVKPSESVWGGDLYWSDAISERRKFIEANPHVLIIGAGQTGLNVAARFQQMRINALVVETNHRVGDNWRKRYPALVLQTPNKYSSMLYQSYPDNWPELLPRDKMADWLEQYVSTQDLVVWTNSRPMPHPKYDDATKRWTVVVDRAGEHLTLHPAHIVVAAGALGAPRMPAVRDKDVFGGTVIHSSDYHGGRHFSGKRVVVVGAGNTAADICQDLTFHGAQSVTMVQRSKTWVASRDFLCTTLRCMYPPELDIEACDLMAMARPVALTRELEKRTAAQTLEQEKDTHRGLREAGFNLSFPDKGIFVLWYEGHGGLDAGCAELIRSGKVRVKQGAEVARFNAGSVMLTDGACLEADTVIFATSYEPITETMRSVFGDAVIDQVGPVWGLDEEGELRGCYRKTGHPGLWFAAGEWYLSRAFSKQLALEIVAIELGLLKI
ncbi:FAD/NAD-P-binding domain-containing protein [Mycena pura]|uniref:FAD/NAD-P-binding domain-containing protein n=1 Tax=Mycena pura TaxID=153505 RepID=A0AAD6VSX9_9AGAR|nr:FAD/NAD-P-binding domain-containing protein [Mycena pura]